MAKSKQKKKSSSTRTITESKPSADKNKKNQEWLKRFGGILGIALLSLIVNFAIFSDYLNSPFFTSPEWDADIYWKWAKDIANGAILGNSIFHQTPLYPYFLALIIKIFGTNLSIVISLQLIISSLSALLIYSISKKLFGEIAGIVAGAFFALYNMQVFYSLKLLSETITILLLLLITFSLVNKFRWRYLLAGIAFGLLITSKPYFLLGLPLVGVYLVLTEKSISSVLKSYLTFLTPAVLIVLSVTLRNYLVEKDFVLISSNGGENFYIGNNPNSDGTYSPVKGISQDIEYQNSDVIAAAEKQVGHTMKRSEVSKYWFHKGIEFIKTNPHKFMRLQLTKVKYLLSGSERSTMYYYLFERANFTHSLSILCINFYIVLPFAIIGFFSLRQKWKQCFILFALLFVNVLNILIFFYDTRFMLLSIPFLCIFAGLGLASISGTLRNIHSLKDLLHPKLVILIILFYGAYLLYTVDKKVKTPDWHMWLTLGEIYYEQKELDSALNAYTKASYLKQGSWMPVIGVSKTCFAMGKKDIAAQLYNSAISNLNEDFTQLVLRDKDLDSLRSYIQINKITAKISPD